MILDLFAGAGGLDLGARQLGLEPLGLELDPVACATREAAGLPTRCADVAQLDPAAFSDVDGLIGGPPCPAWSEGGKKGARADLGRLYGLADAAAAGRPPAAHGWTDDRAVLIAEPLRWAAELRPRWVVLEQVPPALGFWGYAAQLLGEMGYRTWTGICRAEQFGIAQARRRALLIASLERAPGPPRPSHRPHGRRPVGGELLLPPAPSMADALGWGMTDRPYPVLAGARTTGGADKEKVGGSHARAIIYREQAAGRWRGRCSSGDVRLGVADAAVLQGFPADYPLQGTPHQQLRQLTNAVPPPLAAAALQVAGAS